MNFRDFFTISTWWGKLLGAFFGYLSFGPLGAVLGIIVGNFFDKGFIEHFTNPHFAYHAEKRKAIQEVFFKATFLVMGHMAKADGHVSRAEINMAKALMDEMKLNKREKEEAKHYFNEGKQTYFNLDSVLTHLKKSCKDNPQLLKLFLDVQYRTAQVDGLGFQKIQILNHVFASLGFAPLNQQHRFYEDFNEAFTHQEQSKQEEYSSFGHRSATSHTSHMLSQAYALLETQPTSSKQEVKKAYRRLLSRHHPDKLIAKGLSEEQIKIANDKTQKLTKAYELICSSKGW